MEENHVSGYEARLVKEYISSFVILYQFPSDVPDKQTKTPSEAIADCFESQSLKKPKHVGDCLLIYTLIRKGFGLRGHSFLTLIRLGLRPSDNSRLLADSSRCGRH